MKIKIIVLFLLFVSMGIAQQKKATGKDKDEKGIIELKKYPSPLTQISPKYPEVAKLAGIQGKVYVETLIDEKGIVIDTKVIRSEQESLNAAAMDAIKTTKFSPGVNKENKNVKAKVIIPINFKLDEKSTAPDLGVPIDAPGDISDPDINAFQKVEKQPEMIESAKPEYPEEAKTKKITGKVYVKVLISKEGNPKKAVVIKSEAEIFNQPAINAAMKSKFSPALQKGKPVAVWVVLPYRFTLDGKEPKYHIIEHSAVANAKEDFELRRDYFEHPEKYRNKNVAAPIEVNQKIETDISFGDESFSYKVEYRGKVVYNFTARDGKKIFDFSGSTIDEIKAQIEEYKSGKR